MENDNNLVTSHSSDSCQCEEENNLKTDINNFNYTNTRCNPYINFNNMKIEIDKNFENCLVNEDNIFPDYINKKLILSELASLSGILNSNLFFNRNSIKSIQTFSDKKIHASFLTPKFEIIFNHLDFKTFIVKDIINVSK